MITITLNDAEEWEIAQLARQSGLDAGQMAAAILREYLEDQRDALLADQALADILKW